MFTRALELPCKRLDVGKCAKHCAFNLTYNVNLTMSNNYFKCKLPCKTSAIKFYLYSIAPAPMNPVLYKQKKFLGHHSLIFWHKKWHYAHLRWGQEAAGIRTGNNLTGGSRKIGANCSSMKGHLKLTECVPQKKVETATRHCWPRRVLKRS